MKPIDIVSIAAKCKASGWNPKLDTNKHEIMIVESVLTDKEVEMLLQHSISMPVYQQHEMDLAYVVIDLHHRTDQTNDSAYCLFALEKRIFGFFSISPNDSSPLMRVYRVETLKNIHQMFSNSSSSCPDSWSCVFFLSSPTMFETDSEETDSESVSASDAEHNSDTASETDTDRTDIDVEIDAVRSSAHRLSKTSTLKTRGEMDSVKRFSEFSPNDMFVGQMKEPAFRSFITNTVADALKRGVVYVVLLSVSANR